MAESGDGIHWVPRDTRSDSDLPDRMLPNQVLPVDRFGEWSACYVDPHAEPKVGSDPATAVFWNDVRQSYVFTSRPEWIDRDSS